MKNPPDFKKYFHDRIVLLMLTINVFLAFVGVAMILLRLGDSSSSYIQSYRANLGLNAYSVGGVEHIVSFAVFAVIVLIGQFFLSLQMHKIHKKVSWIIMVLAALLLVLSLIVSDSLLKLR